MVVLVLVFVLILVFVLTLGLGLILVLGFVLILVVVLILVLEFVIVLVLVIVLVFYFILIPIYNFFNFLQFISTNYIANISLYILQFLNDIVYIFGMKYLRNEWTLTIWLSSIHIIY
jgi:hypothetical protein